MSPSGIRASLAGDVRPTLETSETDKTRRCQKSQKIPPESIYNGRNWPPILQNIESEKFSAFPATERDGQDKQDALIPKYQKISPENNYNGRDESPNLQNIESTKKIGISVSEQDGKRRNKNWMDENRK